MKTVKSPKKMPVVHRLENRALDTPLERLEDLKDNPVAFALSIWGDRLMPWQRDLLESWFKKRRVDAVIGLDLAKPGSRDRSVAVIRQGKHIIATIEREPVA